MNKAIIIVVGMMVSMAYCQYGHESAKRHGALLGLSAGAGLTYASVPQYWTDPSVISYSGKVEIGYAPNESYGLVLFMNYQYQNMKDLSGDQEAISCEGFGFGVQKYLAKNIIAGVDLYKPLWYVITLSPELEPSSSFGISIHGTINWWLTDIFTAGARGIIDFRTYDFEDYGWTEVESATQISIGIQLVLATF
jgi:hypothetical protein